MKTLNEMLLRVGSWTFPSNDDNLVDIPDGKSASDIVNEGGPMFSTIQTIFTFIGILIVFLTAWRVIKALVAGKIPDAAKSFMGGLVAAILCFNLQLPIQIVQSMSGVFTSVVNALRSVVN